MSKYRRKFCSCLHRDTGHGYVYTKVIFAGIVTNRRPGKYKTSLVSYSNSLQYVKIQRYIKRPMVNGNKYKLSHKDWSTRGTQ